MNEKTNKAGATSGQNVPKSPKSKFHHKSQQEQAALLEKMDAYCREQTGMALADFRARYLVEEPQPRQAPSLAQL